MLIFVPCMFLLWLQVGPLTLSAHIEELKRPSIIPHTLCLTPHAPAAPAWLLSGYCTVSLRACPCVVQPSRAP